MIMGYRHAELIVKKYGVSNMAMELPLRPLPDASQTRLDCTLGSLFFSYKK